MICSCLVPSRKRPVKLSDLVASIRRNATGDENVDYEILVRSDVDDPDTKHICDNMGVLCRVGSRLGGWKDNHLMFQELANMARGEFFWLLNDDMTVEGEKWDEKLGQVPSQAVLIQPEFHKLGGSTYRNDPGGAAPIVQRFCWLRAGVPSIPSEADAAFARMAREQKWMVFFLEGIGVWHQRDADEIRRHRVM